VGYAVGMSSESQIPRVPRRGFFLSLDGPDGGGKTTQVGLLAAWLKGLGLSVVTCRDPGGTALGDRLRAILLDRHDTAIGMRAEMLLYMASRAQLVEEVIRPAIERGDVVVCDRFLLANVVYQGYAGGLPVADLWRVGEVATGGLLPDLTVLVDVAPEVALQRVGRPRDRIEDRPDSFRQAVRRGFLEAARGYPASIVVVDGAADAATVAARIQSEVARALGINPRS
jgi:dTMP kinase